MRSSEEGRRCWARHAKPAITAGTVELGRLEFSPAVFDALHVALWVGLVVLAALALVPLRQVHVANVLVVVLSGFLVVQLGRIAIAPSDPIVLDSPVRGEWFVAAGGRSALINHHYVVVPLESNAVDLVRLGIKQGSARVRVGERVRRGQPLARVGNSGGPEPHLHMHVQNRRYDHTGDGDNLHMYPMTFRHAQVTPGGSWSRADAGELRSGDRNRHESPR